jgi:hypothetical protein
MSLGRWRIVPYLALAALVLAPSVWAGQDWSGWLIAGSFAAVGLVLLWQRPREVVGWLLLGITFAFSAVGSTLPGSASQVVDGRGDAGVTLYAWITAWSASLFFGLFVALAAVFPTGRFAAGRVGTAGRIAVAIPLGFSVVLAFAPTWPIAFADGSVADVTLPFAVLPDWPGWAVLGELVYLGVLAALAISIGTLVARFRRSRGAERAQLKWLLAALAATLAAVVFAFAMIFLVDLTGTWMWIPAVLAYPTIPLSILVAIRRYHLYDIDRLVSRTIGWAIVTGVLVAVFAGLVVGLQAVLAPVTNENTLAVAASTLVAFALFQPLRRRVQWAVDRRFDRARYDGQKTVDAFGERLRDQLDLATLPVEVANVAHETVRPTTVAVWLRHVRPENPAQGS